MTAGRCVEATSGGQSTTRRAMPSSSMSASAAGSWSRVNSNTERPRSSWSRPPRVEPWLSAARLTQASTSDSQRFDSRPASLSSCQREFNLCPGDGRRSMFVKRDEIADRHRELNLVFGAKRIDAEPILEPCDNDREAQRIKARLK